MSETMSSDSMREVLSQTSPFMFLEKVRREELLELLEPMHFSAGQVVFDQCDVANDLYLVASGVVGLFDPSKSPMAFQGNIHPFAYFGEYGILFDCVRPKRAVAEQATVCLKLAREDFLRLISDSMIFSQALARNLRERQGLFQSLNRLQSTINQGSAQGQINFEQLLEDYKKLSPALHKGASESELDFDGWLYAIRRLPKNVTQCHVYLLARTLPTLLAQAEEHSELIETTARRRTTYAVSPGKSVVLVRDGKTDLCDFLTNLALHASESRKLRRRIRSAKVLTKISEALENGDNACETCLQALPLSAGEIKALKKIWPDSLVARISEMLRHHEDYSVFVDKAVYNYNADSAERWCRQIRKASLELMGSLDNIEVDVISSNTHSVLNCLSPFLHHCQSEVLAWGRRHKPEFKASKFRVESDLLYALSYHWLKANPREHRLRTATELKHGIKTLTSTEFTGLQVDLIRVEKLDQHFVDAELKGFEPKPNRLIVNIDYAFGCQAEDIMGGLVLLFGQRIRSVNVIGKAGALVGKRGDILAPTRIVNQEDATVHPIEQTGLTVDELGLDSGNSVHSGPILTVLGTLLQNRELLCYYKYLWNCVGLEMEGSYYARQIERSRDLGMLRSDIAARFLYYVSDLPLQHSSNLAKRLEPWEGIPPLYSITRAILKQIL